LRIIEGGDVGAGDAILSSQRPAHGLTVGDLVAAQRDASREMLERIASVDHVPDGWRAWADRRLRRDQNAS
jgi:MOSC domain-containing protein YiiM